MFVYLYRCTKNKAHNIVMLLITTNPPPKKNAPLLLAKLFMRQKLTSDDHNIAYVPDTIVVAVVANDDWKKNLE